MTLKEAGGEKDVYIKNCRSSVSAPLPPMIEEPATSIEVEDLRYVLVAAVISWYNIPARSLQSGERLRSTGFFYTQIRWATEWPGRFLSCRHSHQSYLTEPDLLLTGLVFFIEMGNKFSAPMNFVSLLS